MNQFAVSGATAGHGRNVERSRDGRAAGIVMAGDRAEEIAMMGDNVDGAALDGPNVAHGGPHSRCSGFGDVVREHLPWLYELARRLIADPDAAEDAVQTCLLKAFRAYGGLNDVNALAAWLRRILVNCCYDHLRAAGAGPVEEPVHGLGPYERGRVLATSDLLPGGDDVNLDDLAMLDVGDVHVVLERLPGRYRVPLVLVHMEGYLVREVAEFLGVPANTLLSRLHRGRERFARELRDFAEERDLLRGPYRPRDLEAAEL